LASKFLKYQLPEGPKPWWEVFNAKIEDLEEISNQILDLYESPGSLSQSANAESKQELRDKFPDGSKQEIISKIPDSKQEVKE